MLDNPAPPPTHIGAHSETARWRDRWPRERGSPINAGDFFCPAVAHVGRGSSTRMHPDMRWGDPAYVNGDVHSRQEVVGCGPAIPPGPGGAKPDLARSK